MPITLRIKDITIDSAASTAHVTVNVTWDRKESTPMIFSVGAYQNLADLAEKVRSQVELFAAELLAAAKNPIH